MIVIDMSRSYMCILVTHATAQPCLHTVGMDSKSFNPKKIVTLKSVSENKDYPKKDRRKLLPTDKNGVPLKEGETEVKIVADRKRPQEVGEVKVIVPKKQRGNVKKVELLAERPGEKEPTLVKEFDNKELQQVQGNLLKGRNPIKTKAVILRITKKKGKPVNLKVNVKVCAKTTTGRDTFFYYCV